MCLTILPCPSRSRFAERAPYTLGHSFVSVSAGIPGLRFLYSQCGNSPATTRISPLASICWNDAQRLVNPSGIIVQRGHGLAVVADCLLRGRRPRVLLSLGPRAQFTCRRLKAVAAVEGVHHEESRLGVRVH